MAAGWGSGEEAITDASHGSTQIFVYVRRKRGEQCISIDLSTDTVSQGTRQMLLCCYCG